MCYWYTYSFHISLSLSIFFFCNVCSIMLHQDILQMNQWGFPIIKHHIDGLVQEWRNSIALAMELRLSCINPLTWALNHQPFDYWLNWLFRLTSKEISKIRITGPFWGESTGHRWIPLTKGQSCGKSSHVMMTSCHIAQAVSIRNISFQHLAISEPLWLMMKDGIS